MAQGYDSLNFDNVWRNWIQNQIETANARGLLQEGANRFLQNERVKSIDNIINQAFKDLKKPNRGVMVSNQKAVSMGPTSKSAPKQLPKLWEPNFTMGESGALNTARPTSNITKALPVVVNSGLPVKPSPKPMLDPITLGIMGLQAMYGKRSNGELGTGAQLLQQTPWGQLIYGKPQPDPTMAKAEEEAKKRNQEIINWFANKFNKGNKQPGGNSNNLPPLDVIDDSSVGSNTNNIPSVNRAVQPQTISPQQTDIAPQSGDIVPDQQQQANGIQAINDYVQQLKDINQPYLEALQGYIDNYNNLFNQQQMYGRRLRDISAITGNPIWYQSSRDYNPVIQEANRMNAIKQLQQAQATDVNAINEMMGNLAAVQQMGLTPETAFANKNLLTMMAAKDREDNRLQIALENNLMKKYGIDRNYARALTVQAMRNQGAMDRAILNAQTFGYGGYQPAPGLNARGQAATSQDLTMKQILQQAAKQNK